MPPDLPYRARVEFLRDLARRAGQDHGTTWHARFDRMALYGAACIATAFILGYLSSVVGLYVHPTFVPGSQDIRARP
jgi:hypothetical protein